MYCKKCLAEMTRQEEQEHIFIFVWPYIDTFKVEADCKDFNLNALFIIINFDEKFECFVHYHMLFIIMR